MSKKYDDFIATVEKLCEKHDVRIVGDVREDCYLVISKDDRYYDDQPLSSLFANRISRGRL